MIHQIINNPMLLMIMGSLSLVQAVVHGYYLAKIRPQTIWELRSGYFFQLALIVIAVRNLCIYWQITSIKWLIVYMDSAYSPLLQLSVCVGVILRMIHFKNISLSKTNITFMVYGLAYYPESLDDVIIEENATALANDLSFRDIPEEVSGSDDYYYSEGVPLRKTASAAEAITLTVRRSDNTTYELPGEAVEFGGSHPLRPPKPALPEWD